MFYPVIMCGGGGSRLWPTSTAARPKQFLPVLGAQSIFQSTALRVAGLKGVADLVIVAGEAHADIIETQLAQLGLRGVLLLEPTGRDSGPAIAAAALWIHQCDPEGVAVLVASDHHLPDMTAFRDAVHDAEDLARQGRIVTFGVTPAGPSTAYGYIAPGAPRGVGYDVAAFVEKPGAADAARYVDAGYLWNSGNFVATARTLVEELDRHAAPLADPVRAALNGSAGARGRVRLGSAFHGVPRIAFDHAVMEKTARACVLPVGFEWSDLGSWSAIRAVMTRDDAGNGVVGDAITIDATDCLIRSDGPLVAVVGVSNLAVIVENGAVLVCHLDADQSVKAVSNHRHALTRAAPSAAPEPDPGADRVVADLDHWLRTSALPVWWTLGADHRGWGFHETLDFAGRAEPVARRARVQARQAYAFARAGRLRWDGPWEAAVAKALDALEAVYRRPDGLYRRLADARGGSLDETALLYDQAFVLLALSEAARVAPNRSQLIARAETIRTALEAFRWEGGGFREAGDHPFQANCHMHLFECCMAWMSVDGAAPAPWRRLAQEIADLAATRFIDPATGVLREVFDGQWRAAGQTVCGNVEPGHQFEWASLMAQWRDLGGEVDPALIKRLYDAGRAGFDPERGTVVNRMTEAFEVTDGGSRLWPQTEWLRAAMMMGRQTGDESYDADSVMAGRAVKTYLNTPISGLWRDVFTRASGFEQAPAPASSLYHLACFLQDGRDPAIESLSPDQSEYRTLRFATGGG